MEETLSRIRVVLVRTSHPGNIGAAAVVATGVISGSGASYRFVLPVGTNYYAT